MSALLYGPPHLDEAHWLVACQHPECSVEREAREMVQCQGCGLCWCPDHFWSVDYELCLECVLLDYARLDTMRRRLERWGEVVRDELVANRGSV